MRKLTQMVQIINVSNSITQQIEKAISASSLDTSPVHVVLSLIPYNTCFFNLEYLYLEFSQYYTMISHNLIVNASYKCQITLKFNYFSPKK